MARVDSIEAAVERVLKSLKPGQRPSEEEIINFCKANLAPYKVARRVEIRAELPKSSTGKILNRELRKER